MYRHRLWGWARRGSALEFRILGPLEIEIDQRTVARPGTPKERALIIALLIARGRVVRSERLAEDLFAGTLSARQGLRVQVSRVRRSLTAAGLPPDLIETCPQGYAIRLDGRSLDVSEFEATVAEAGSLRVAEERHAEAEVLRTALGFWRGAALVDVLDYDFARPEATRLEEGRLAALEARIEADLACGRHFDVAGELEGLTALHPLRENLWRLRMLATYRCGRQADALATYRQLRTTLVEELGLEPSRSVAVLERDILAQEPGLDWQGAPAPGRAPMPPPPPEVPTVMIVDDHPLWRQAMRSVLEAGGWAKVVGEAGSGEEAVDGVRESRPQVVLMDLRLGDRSGVDVTADVLAASPTTRVVVLSASGDENDVVDAVRAGACGYLLKTSTGPEVAAAVARAAAGEAVFSPSLAELVLDEFRRLAGNREGPSGLTARQRNVLRMVARGLTYPEIAERLGIAEDRVRAEVTAVADSLHRTGGRS